MLQRLKKEIQVNQSVLLTDPQTPLVSYSSAKSLLMIRETNKQLDQLHTEAIKTIIADHLTSRSVLDIVLHLNDLGKQKLPHLYDLFKYCKGLTEWNRKIDIAWFISDHELNMQRMANDVKDMYDLDLRILTIG